MAAAFPDVPFSSMLDLCHTKEAGVLINLKIAVCCVVRTVTVCWAPDHFLCAGNKTWLGLKTRSLLVCSFHRLLSSQNFLFNTQHILFWFTVFFKSDRAKHFTVWAGCSVTSHSRLGLRVWNSPMWLDGFRTGWTDTQVGVKLSISLLAWLLHTFQKLGETTK